ncbi:MAG: hypothetical protein U0547_11070 [Dehalococcoidia bacterium]
MIEVVGWAAVALTQVFWVPNIARLVRTRDVDGHSLTAWLVMVAGLACWLLYFAVKGDVVGMVANVSGVTGAAVTTFCVWKWRRRGVRSVHVQSLESERLEVQAESA